MEDKKESKNVFMHPRDWNLFQLLYAHVLFSAFIVLLINFFVWLFS